MKTFAEGEIKYVYGKHAAGVKDIASNRTRGQLASKNLNISHSFLFWGTSYHFNTVGYLKPHNI